MTGYLSKPWLMNREGTARGVFNPFVQSKLEDIVPAKLQVKVSSLHRLEILLLTNLVHLYAYVAFLLLKFFSYLPFSGGLSNMWFQHKTKLWLQNSARGVCYEKHPWLQQTMKAPCFLHETCCSFMFPLQEINTIETSCLPPSTLFCVEPCSLAHCIWDPGSVVFTKSLLTPWGTKSS